MRPFLTIAVNAFMELVRQPVFLLLTTASVGFEVFLAATPYFGFGEDPQMVKDSVLAVMLLSGMLCAVLSASASLAREIRTGTALAVLSKPVSRMRFLLAKYAGLAAALTVLTYVNLLGALLASRMAFDAFGDADQTGLFLWLGAIALAYAAGGLSNFFLRRVFTADAMFALVVFATLAFVVNSLLAKTDPTWRGGRIGAFANVDWRMIPAAVLILFALWILASIALACSTRLDMIPTLAICTAVLLLGLMSDYLFRQPAEQGNWLASALYTLTPNWQLLWITEAMETPGPIPGVWIYVAKAFAYVVGYAGAALAAALWLFEDRELS